MCKLDGAQKPEDALFPSGGHAGTGRREANIKCESSFNASWPGFLKTLAEFGAVGMMVVEAPLQHHGGSGDLE